jgi:hypothetical protein
MRWSAGAERRVLTPPFRAFTILPRPDWEAADLGAEFARAVGTCPARWGCEGIPYRLAAFSEGRGVENFWFFMR